MKSFIQSTISYLDMRVSFRQAGVTDKASCRIIAGYTRLFEPGQNDIRAAKRGDRQVAILYGDIVDCARLTRGNGLAASGRVCESRKIFQACIASSRGKLARFSGDAILAEFEDVESALRCAVKVQLAIRRRNAQVDPAGQVRYRIGISVCELTGDQAAVCARAINLSARLEDLALTSGICVSPSARQNIRENSKIRFVPLGKRYLRDVCEPVEAFWIEVEEAELDEFDLPASARVSAVVS